MKTHPDRLDERIRLGEVPPHLADMALARRGEPDFEAAQAALEESDRRILSMIPPDRFAAEVARRREGRRNIEAARRNLSPSAKAAWGSVAIACLAGLVFVVPGSRDVPAPRHAPSEPAPNAVPSPAPAEPPAPDLVSANHAAPPRTASAEGKDWRTKGETTLVLQSLSGGAPVALTDSDTCPPGTRLRLSVPDSLPWAAVYSIDSRGQMAQHWPLEGDSAKPLPQGALPRSWELDDAPGKETFVLAWSEKPFQLDRLRKSIFLDRSHPKVGAALHVKVVQVARPGSRAR